VVDWGGGGGVGGAVCAFWFLFVGGGGGGCWGGFLLFFFLGGGGGGGGFLFVGGGGGWVFGGGDTPPTPHSFPFPFFPPERGDLFPRCGLMNSLFVFSPASTSEASLLLLSRGAAAVSSLFFEESVKETALLSFPSLEGFWLFFRWKGAHPFLNAIYG